MISSTATSSLLLCARLRSGGIVYTINPATGNLLDDGLGIRDHYRLFSGVQVSSTRAVVSGEDGVLSCICVNTKHVTFRYRTGCRLIRAVSHLPLHELVAAGGSNGRIRLFGFRPTSFDANLHSPFRGHVEQITDLLHSHHFDSQTLFSCSSDRTVRVWDLSREDACLRVIREHTGSVYALAFDPVQNILFSGGSDRTIKLWDARSPRNCIYSMRFRCVLETMLFRESPSSRQPQLIVPLSLGGPIHVFDLRKLIPLHSWPSGHSWTVSGCCDVPDHDLFVTSGVDDKKLIAWREDGEKVWEWGPASSAIGGVFRMVDDYGGYSMLRIEMEDMEERIGFLMSLDGSLSRLNVRREELDSAQPLFVLFCPRSVMNAFPIN